MLTLKEAISLDVKRAKELYKTHLNPGLMEIYELLGVDEIDIEHAEGMQIYLRDGRTLLDFSSSIGVLGLGHNHPRIIAAEQLCHKEKIVDAIKVAPHKLQAALAHNLSQLLPDPLEVCFLTVSGAEAVEAAMKLCERAQGLDKTKFISVSGSFHGKTHGSLSVTNSGGFQRGFLMGVPEENCIEVPYGDLYALERVIQSHETTLGDNTVIAIILEAFQGQGLVTPPPGYLKGVVALAKEYDILTIFDEVKVSMGRTGTFCAFQVEDVVPDVVTISKSLGGGKRAVGAMVTSQKIFKEAYPKRKDSSLHTTTFGGLGSSCAVAIEALNVLVEENLVQAAREKGDYLRARLLELQAKHSGKITGLLGRGLLQGVRFSFSHGYLHLLDSIMMASVIRYLYEEHNILAHFSASDPDILHIMPPLIVEESHLEKLVEAIDDILTQGIAKITAGFVKNNLLP